MGAPKVLPRPKRPEARPNLVRISQRWGILTALFVLLALAACEPTGGFDFFTFWQEVGDRPGRAADPYSRNPDCELVREEWRLIRDDPDDITSGTFWIKRIYLCPVGTT